MTRALTLGTLVGGLVALVWSTISWGMLGWHEKTMLGFQNDSEVSAVIASHAPQDGTYLLPYMPPTQGMTPEQKKSAQATAAAKFQQGPIVVAAVRRGGFPSIGRAMVIQALNMFVAAFLLTWLYMQTRGLSYARSVVFFAVVGVAASVIIDLPNWNWWGFSGAYTAASLADAALTWLLAGLAIAKVAKPATN
jgi:hypothetical protein